MEMDKKIFNEQIIEYASIVFGKFFEEIFYMLPGAIISSIASFFLAIFFLIILTKKKMFRRDNKIWNLVAKLHYPIWIAVFIIAGFFNGAISALGSRAENVLEETGKPIIEASIPVLYEYLINELPTSSPNEKITIRSATNHIMNDIAYTPKSDSQIENLKKNR
jgi:hypothetical protein